jgi:ABC-type sugar transport system substrate-binding protein
MRNATPRVAWAALAMCSAGALALSACSSSSTSTSASSAAAPASGGSGQVKVGVIIKGLDNPYFQTMEAGVKAAAAADHVSVTIEAAQSITDTTGQAAALDALANENLGCYVVNPISGTNLVQGIAKIAAKGTPIVNIDNPVDPAAAKAASAQLASYIGTNDVSAGAMAGQEMKKLLPTGGEVVVIAGLAGDVTSEQRTSGFAQGIAGSSIKVLQTVDGNWVRQDAFTDATTALNAHPGIAGFFVANDDMALGVARAVENAHKTGQVKIVSVDGITQNLSAIGTGQTTATVSQYPWVMGFEGVEACEAAIQHKTLPASVPAPITLITHGTAAQALAKFPEPFASYDDPFKGLLGR